MSHALENGSGLESAFREELRRALVELSEEKPVTSTTVVDVEEPELSCPTVLPEPEPRHPQGLIRVRLHKDAGHWDSSKQPYFVIRGLTIATARAVAIDLNLRRMLNSGSTTWHAVAHFGSNNYGVVKVKVPAEWQAHAPSDWPYGAELGAKAVRTAKTRNKGLLNANVDELDWWLVAYRLD